MPDNAHDLPEGFELDQQHDLPEGFEVDKNEAFKARPGTWGEVLKAPSAQARAQAPLAGGFMRNALESFPLTGPTLSGIANKANAATYATLSPLLPNDTTVSQANNWKQRYQENLDREAERGKSFDKEHPTAKMISGLFGSAVGAGPFFEAAGPSLAANTLVGGGLSAADTAARGGSAGDIARDATIGAVVPGVAHGVGQAVGGAIRPELKAVPHEWKPNTGNGTSGKWEQVYPPEVGAEQIARKNPNYKSISVPQPLSDHKAQALGTALGAAGGGIFGWPEAGGGAFFGYGISPWLSQLSPTGLYEASHAIPKAASGPTLQSILYSLQRQGTDQIK